MTKILEWLCIQSLPYLKVSATTSHSPTLTNRSRSTVSNSQRMEKRLTEMKERECDEKGKRVDHTCPL